jgi:hypothetical protein
MRDMRDSVLRAVSLVVTDRRWAAPLSAMALGFGLFLGVAIGPGAAGGLAVGPGQILAVSPVDTGQANTSGGEDLEAGGFPEAEPSAGEAEPFEAPLEAEFAPEPLTSEPEEEAPREEEPAGPAPEEEPETEAVELAGTVVHVNPAAGSYTLATKGGELVSLHAAKLPPAGSKFSVEGMPLTNNTFAEEERERAGAATKATLRGVVTYVDPDSADPAYTVSGRGSSILVHVAPEPAPQLPALGAYATVGVGIQKAPAAEPALPAPAEAPPAEAPTCVPDPGLAPPAPPAKIVVQRQLSTEPEPATYVDLAGIVSAVCPATGQLLISADDLREGEADLLLAVPTGIKTAKLKVGDSVLATATVGEDAALTLAGLASDERTKGAEDAASAQGDLKR